LGSAIATTLGANSADAAAVDLTLRVAANYVSGGSTAGNITSSTATWSYDTVAGILTQTGGTFNVRYIITPTTTLFRHTATGMLLGAPTATASSYACVEGNFGGNVGASLCGNYNFGANFVHESTATWGPGTATARTLGGDDMALGPMQSISAYDAFTVVSWDGTVLKIGNKACNPGAPGGANGCAISGGFNTGIEWTLSTPIPAAAWLFGSAVALLAAAGRRARA
jgi:hypothetical protein